MCESKEYVYVLTHIPTGKKYVGRSKDPKRRCMSHMNALLSGYHTNKAMLADYQKYGGDYKFEIVSEEHDRIGRINSDEKQWMLKLRTYDERYGYNDKDNAMTASRIEHGLPTIKFYWDGKTKKKKEVVP